MFGTENSWTVLVFSGRKSGTYNEAMPKMRCLGPIIGDRNSELVLISSDLNSGPILISSDLKSGTSLYLLTAFGWFKEKNVFTIELQTIWLAYVPEMITYICAKIYFPTIL